MNALDKHDLIVRRFPQAKYGFLKFQAGIPGERPDQYPEPGVLTLKRRSPVFHLLGWGETEEKAVQMAKRHDWLKVEDVRT